MNQNKTLAYFWALIYSNSKRVFIKNSWNKICLKCENILTHRVSSGVGFPKNFNFKCELISSVPLLVYFPEPAFGDIYYYLYANCQYFNSEEYKNTDDNIKHLNKEEVIVWKGSGQ